MQDQTSRSRLLPSRNFPYFCTHSGTDRFVRRYPYPKTHPDVVPFSYVRVAPGQWFENPAVDGASRRLATMAGSQHSLAGVNTRNLSQPDLEMEMAARFSLQTATPGI